MAVLSRPTDLHQPSGGHSYTCSQNTGPTYKFHVGHDLWQTSLGKSRPMPLAALFAQSGHPKTRYLGAMTDVTRILSQIESGDPSAADLLLPLVYEELRKVAAAKMVHEKPGQSRALRCRTRGVPAWHLDRRHRRPCVCMTDHPASWNCGGETRIAPFVNVTNRCGRVPGRHRWDSDNSSRQ